jgi:hypothetical protein
MKQCVIKSIDDMPRLWSWLSHWLSKGLEGGKPVSVTLKHESRSDRQNKQLWACLGDFAKQADYPSGSGLMRTAEQWKIIFISAYKYDPCNILIGLNNELVNIGYSSKALPKEQFSELIEFIFAEGASRGVKFGDPAMAVYEEWCNQVDTK